MQKEKFLLEKIKEKEPEEISRYKLDPEKGIDVEIEAAANIRLPQDLKNLGYAPAKVILKHKEKDILNFSELLPKDHNLVFIGRNTERLFRKSGNLEAIWEYDDIDKIVIIPRQWDEKAKDILALLHEISHSFDIDRIRKSKYGKSQDITSEEARKADLELNSQIERDAWANALAIARQIKKQRGIDLLKPFRGDKPKETRKNLEKYIHGRFSLGCAEELNISKGPFKEELKGLFTTKYYKGEKFTTEHRKKIRRKE